MKNVSGDSLANIHEVLLAAVTKEEELDKDLLEDKQKYKEIIESSLSW